MNINPNQNLSFFDQTTANPLKRSIENHDEDNFPIKKARLNPSDEENELLDNLLKAFERAYENEDYFHHFTEQAEKYFVKNCNVSVNMGPYQGATPLLLASILAEKFDKKELWKLVKKMVKETPCPNCDVTTQHEEHLDRTPLYIAASCAEIDLVELMIEKKPDANYAAGPDCNVLWWMALNSEYGNCWSIIEQVIKSSSNINCLVDYSCGCSKSSIFGWAVIAYEWEIAELIIESNQQAKSEDFIVSNRHFIDYICEEDDVLEFENSVLYHNELLCCDGVLLAIKFLKKYPETLKKYIDTYPPLATFIDSFNNPSEKSLKAFLQFLHQHLRDKRRKKTLKNKEKFKIRSLGHCFELPLKKYYLSSSGTSKEFKFKGGELKEWRPYMSKVNRLMQKNFPATFNMPLSDHIDLALNPGEILSRIQRNLPTSLDTGFRGHAVCCLFWGQYFILCNRGNASRKPIEVYLYDSKRMTSEVVNKLHELKSLEKNEYTKYLFTELPKILDFRQEELQLGIEKCCLLADQTMGNCSWASLEGLVWSVVMLNQINQTHESITSLENIVKKVNAIFQFWLLGNQFYFLEKFYGLRNFRETKQKTEKRQVSGLTLTFRNDKEIRQILFRKLQAQLALLQDNFPESHPIFQNYAQLLALEALKK